MMLHTVFVFLLLLILLLCHTIADFFMQTRHDAENKWHSVKALCSHCIDYSLFMTIATLGIIWVHLDFLLGGFIGICVFIFIFTGHFITDYVTSKLSHKYHEKGEIRKFWRVIGIDQFIHIVHITLLLIGLLTITKYYDNSTSKQRDTEYIIEI